MINISLAAIREKYLLIISSLSDSCAKITSLKTVKS